MAEQLFRGKVALITGAVAGIGFATAKAFAEAGAAVALLDLDEAGVMKSAADLKRSNIAEEQQVNTCIEYTVATLGQLDLACNNAGIHVPSADTADATGQDFDRAVAVNLRGVWDCMKYEPAHMRQQGHRSIVNVSSNSGLVGKRSARICHQRHPHQCRLLRSCPNAHGGSDNGGSS